MSDPSLLRFLVDMRGEDADDKQLRDDLMTMLIAGHETTAAVLTWALFSVAQNPEVEERLLREIDSVVGDRAPGELQKTGGGGGDQWYDRQLGGRNGATVECGTEP